MRVVLGAISYPAPLAAGGGRPPTPGRPPLGEASHLLAATGTAPGVRRFGAVLTANRSDPAVRAARDFQEMGIRPVVVYSDEDRGSPGVRLSRVALSLFGGGADAYNNVARVIEAAKAAGAEAVYPGFGFLAENADAAAAIAAAGLVWVGPSAEAIRAVGNKTAAKAVARRAGVPTIPGSDSVVPDLAAALAVAQGIGYPVKIKGEATGGGRGMRNVWNGEEMPRLFKEAQDEARGSTGGIGDVFIERLIKRARHLEVQVAADAHGNIVVFRPRDCTAQFNHQKVIEETPAHQISSEREARLREQARKIFEQLRSDGTPYVGLGTVEFILDLDVDKIYFIEVNTRIQVEHPLNEETAGVNLVKTLIEIAEGRPLPFREEDVLGGGCAIEARVNVNDPRNNLAPAPGRLVTTRWALGRNVRHDAGVDGLLRVSPTADPMIMKVVARGQTREEARATLVRALREMVVLGDQGLKTNIPFLIRYLEGPFQADDHTTTTIEEFLPTIGWTPTLDQAATAVVSAATALLKTELRVAQTFLARNIRTRIPSARIPPPSRRTYSLVLEEKSYEVSVARYDLQRLLVTVNGEQTIVDADYTGHGNLLVFPEGLVRDTHLVFDGDLVRVSYEGDIFEVQRKGVVQGPRVPGLLAGIRGEVTSIPENIKPGARIKPGELYVVIKAMKMQNEKVAKRGGVVKAVRVAPGNQVAPDALIVEFEPEAGEEMAETKAVAGVDFKVPGRYERPPPLERLHRFFLGFDVGADEAGVVAEKCQKPEDQEAADQKVVDELVQSLVGESRSREAYLRRLNYWLEIFLTLHELEGGNFRREFLTFWNRMDQPGYLVSERLASIILRFLKGYGVPIEERRKSVEVSGKTQELNDEPATVAATIALHRGESQKALLQVARCKTHGLADREAALARLLKASHEWIGGDFADILVATEEALRWDSPLRREAIEALKVVSPELFNAHFPGVVAPEYSEAYKQLDAPLARVSQGEIEEMRNSLGGAFVDDPFRDLPSELIDRGEVDGYRRLFDIRPLYSPVPNTFAFELVGKGDRRDDRRYLVLSAVPQERTVALLTDHKSRLLGVPVIEGGFIAAARVAAMYQNIAFRSVTHPVVFVLRQGSSLRWGGKSPLNTDSALRIGRRVNAFALKTRGTGTRIVFDSWTVDGKRRPREVIRYRMGHGRPTAEIQQVGAEPIQYVTPPEVDRAARHAKGLLTVDERLDMMFGRGQWREVRFEKEGWDVPGRKSAAKVGWGYIEGHRVFFEASDPTVAAGAIDQRAGRKIVAIKAMAGEAARMGEEVGVVNLLDSGGAHVADGIGSLGPAAHGMNTTVVQREDFPTVTAILGSCAGWKVYDPSVSEGEVVMVGGTTPHDSQSTMFLTGPKVLEKVTGRVATFAEIGGAATHTEDTGVADVKASNDWQAVRYVRALLAFHLGEKFQIPKGLRHQPRAGLRDIRGRLAGLVDEGQFFELKPHFGSVFTGMARKGGHNLGIVATYPENDEELTKKSLHKVVDAIRLFANRGLPIIWHQRTPIRLGDLEGDPQIASWNNRFRAEVHRIAREGRVRQYSIIKPRGGRWQEGEIDAAADVIIFVNDGKVDEKALQKACGYADFVVESTEAAYELVAQLEGMFKGRRLEAKKYPAGPPALVAALTPDDREQGYDMKTIIKGGTGLKGVKVGRSEDEVRGVFRTLFGVTGNFEIYQDKNAADEAERQEAERQKKLKAYAVTGFGEGAELTVKAYRVHRPRPALSDDTLKILNPYREKWKGELPSAVDPSRLEGLFEDREEIYVEYELSGGSFAGLFDANSPFLEFRADEAPNLVTGWTRYRGRVVSVLANQPSENTGAADILSSEKAGRFIRLNDRLGVPMVFLTHMTGFMPGDEAIIDAGGMGYITPMATFGPPIVKVTLGPDIGGGLIAHASKFIRGRVIGGDFVSFNYTGAIPRAEMLVMGEEPALPFIPDFKEILTKVHRADRDAVEKILQRVYLLRLAHPSVALAAGEIDEVVPPEGVRDLIGRGLDESGQRIHRSEVATVVGAHAEAAEEMYRRGLEAALVAEDRGWAGPIAKALALMARAAADVIVGQPREIGPDRYAEGLGRLRTLAEGLGMTPEAEVHDERGGEGGGGGPGESAAGRSSAAFQPIMPSRVMRGLRGTLVRDVEYYPVVESTNDVARGLAEKGDWNVVVVADEQTAGRGTRGRSWYSRPGLGLTFSVPIRVNPEVTPLLPFAVAAAVRDAIRRTDQSLASRAVIKWPNDVLIDEKKASGVLIESFDLEGEKRGAVVGVGINVNGERDDLDPSVRDRATTLSIARGQPIDREKLLISFLRELNRWCLKLERENGRTELIDYVNRHGYLRGRSVSVQMGEEVVMGSVVRVAESGALVVRGEDGQEREIVTGDVEVIESKPSSG